MKITEEKINEVLDLFNKNVSPMEIKRLTKLGKNTVYRILKENGLNKTTRFYKETEEEICKKYLEGMSSIVLANAYNCNSKTMSNILERYGIKRRTNKDYTIQFTLEQIEDIKNRWFAGESQKKIAADYCRHQTVISRVLRHFGILKEDKLKGKRNHKYRGGKTKKQSGYVFLRIEKDAPFYDMSNSLSYVAEHRLVMARHLGRPLTRKEQVHHINGIKNDNRIENLQLRVGHHGNGSCFQCADCKSTNIIPIPI